MDIGEQPAGERSLKIVLHAIVVLVLFLCRCFICVYPGVQYVYMNILHERLSSQLQFLILNLTS